MRLHGRGIDEHCAGGPPAVARAWKRSIQTPLAAQRTKRL